MAATSIVSEVAGDLKYFVSKLQEGEKVWVKGSKESVWELGEVTAASSSSEEDTVVVKTFESKKDVVTRKAFGGEIIPVENGKVGYSDMTAMRFVNEPQILENLRQRSYGDQPYTFMGPVLVAVNPLKNLSKELGLEAGQKNVVGKAHPFAVAELAYQQLLFAVKRPGENADTPTNQTVVVSGESGAGKTVSSKMVLEHLVVRSGGGGDLAQAMLGSNPITESFGNSQTLRNPNSSRFGKMFRIMFNESGSEIVGASVGTYLLERSRVTNHELGERNYHIFYELLRGGSDALLGKLHLQRDAKYKALLPHTQEESKRNVFFVDGDKANFEAVTNSLKIMGIDGDNFVNLMGIVAGVLHLSNVEFDALVVSGNDASKVSDASRSHLNFAAELFGVDAGELELVFTELERKVGAQVIKSPVSSYHAAQLLEGVTKAVYTRLFQHMIHTVNGLIDKTNNPDLPTIGVLDIFGFETFQKNDIEQLLINFTNEALQLTFNKQVLEAEASLYTRENLAMTEQDRAALDPSQVVDQSNKLCIDLLAGVTLEPAAGKKKAGHLPGILDVIHEQGRIPNPSEKKMLDKLHKTFAGKDLYPNYMVIRKKAKTEFIIKHYAGRVTYTTGNFLLKNVDSLPKSAADIFLSSTKQITKAVWDAGASLVSGKKGSIVSTFKKQITTLNNDLNATQCSFIRCMKPNAEMHRNEGWFNRRYITVQLRNLSVPKTADVLKAGLPTRMDYKSLVETYVSIFGKDIKPPNVESESEVKSFIAALFFAFEIPRSCYKLGLTKVFFKSGDLDKLEEVLSAADGWIKGGLDATAEAERARIVERYKSYYSTRRWKVVLATMYAQDTIKNLLVSQRARKELEKKSAILLQRQLRMFVAKKKYAAMLHAKKLEEERIAREKAEAERLERERLAAIARQKEIEKQEELRKYLEIRREAARKQQAKFRKMQQQIKEANATVAEIREKERELKRQERERREQEEKERREEAERQRKELEQLRLAREEEERKAQEAAVEAQKRKLEYEEKLREEILNKERADLEKAKAQGASKESLAENQKYMDFIANKLKRDEAKLQEKVVMEQVVQEIMDRENERKLREFEDEDEKDVLDDENPWCFYEDLNLDDIDNISHDSRDEERINEALRFLDTLGDNDTDDESDNESDLESLTEERNLQIAHRADNKITHNNFKDYTGPFIVQVFMQKLEENSLKPKKRRRFLKSSNNWKQCFAFVYPAHERVLLHEGTSKTMKIQFNAKDSANPAVVKHSDTYPPKRKHVLHVVGVSLMDEDTANEPVSRELIISFQDSAKRTQFATLLEKFVLREADRAKMIQSLPNAAKKAMPGAVEQFQAKAPGYHNRNDRRDQIRKANYTKFALLNRAIRHGKLNKDRVHDILLQNDDEEEEEDQVAQVKSCVKCSRAVTATSAVCPHCGSTQ